MFSTIKIRSASYEMLLLFNWYLLGVEMNLGHAHKTRFLYLLGLLSKFSDEHPRPLYRRVALPPGSKSTVLLSY